MRLLTIAGSDSGAAAGIQADLRVFWELGAEAASVVTAVTAQNSRRVYAIHSVPPPIVAQQIDAVVAEDPEGEGIAAVKTGMLATPAVAATVADKLTEHALPNLVVDPVLAAHSGRGLLEHRAIPLLRDRLLPLATVATPNVPEAEALLGTHILDLEGARRAVRRFRELGCRWALLKGSHLPRPGNTADEGTIVDLLSDGDQVFEFAIERLPVSTHGTGCMLSAAVAAHLGVGRPVPEAVRLAQRYVQIKLRTPVT